MHTLSVLHTLLSPSVPTLHARRRQALVAVITSLVGGAQASVTAIGRGLSGRVRDKHKIKRADRLLSNRNLYQERQLIYTALIHRLTQHVKEPIILIDWSPLCADQSWQLLRAAIPVGGRALTLYEEAHPRHLLSNRRIQHQFLATLAAMMPKGCCPIVIADSGFKTPFYDYIENTLKWHWVGRIRGLDLIRYNTDEQWLSAKSLHAMATTTPVHHGVIEWTKRKAFSALMVLVKQTKKGRQSLTFTGKNRQAKYHKVHAKHEREPWVLVASLSLKDRSAKQIMTLYSSRMQIEEGFRDAKSTRYGLGLSQHIGMNKYRRSILCLLASLALFVLWCIGVAAQKTGKMRWIQVHSIDPHSSYSAVFLARQLIRQRRCRGLSKAGLKNAIQAIQQYGENLLCES